MHKLYTCIFFLVISLSTYSQKLPIPAKPKLVVGLVVDQMRWDYLYRYQKRYSANGFMRLLNKGYSFQNTLIPYVPTYTAVGHTCVYTGSVPAFTGIVGNNWWERSINKNMYCTTDTTVQAVGGSDYAGKMSPRNLWATTMCDELRLVSNFKSKVIGIALKDRGAILTAGHSANAAYWFDEGNGKWITSSYYMQTLPAWLTAYNDEDVPGKLMSKDWNTLYPMDSYIQSTPDANNFEGKLPNTAQNNFPYATSKIEKGKYITFKYTPYAATATLDFARKAINAEQLGQGAATDFLAVSISSTDYTGHSFGPNSVEIEDTYLRLDKDVESFLNYLDAKLGANNYLIFLTADHGAAHVPSFMKDHKLSAGNYDEIGLETELDSAIKLNFGIERGISNAQNYQVYLNDSAIVKKGRSIDEVTQFIVNYLKSKSFVTDAFPTRNIAVHTIAEPLKTSLINGFQQKRSGDIQFLLKPNYFDGYSTGTTHGLWNPYDAHIPLLFYGWRVPPGKSYRTTYMTDIAPTICAMLNIQQPNANVGHALTELAR